MSTASEGVEFDFLRKKYRIYGSYFFLKFGEWKKFEDFTFIAIGYTSTQVKMGNYIQPSANLTTNFYAVRVHYTNGRRRQSILLNKSKNKEKMLKVARMFSEKLQIELKDATHGTLKKDRLTGN